MAKRPARAGREPHWLSRLVLDSVHADQIREHGGLPGVRDENGLDAALARPRQKWVYGAEPDIASLAAAYGFGIARHHPYRDGNRRIAFLASATFLGINDLDLDVTDAAVVTEMLSLAAGDVTEVALAEWIRNHLAAS